MKQLKLGFLTVHGDSENHSQMMNGVFEAAEKHQANVIRFAAKVFDGELDKYNMELNHLYKIIEAQELDGLMFLGWMPGLVGEYFQDFLDRFHHIPIVSLGTGYDKIPNVYSDSEKCINELLEHMINIHGYHNIAFVPPGIPDARSMIYKNIMQKYNIFQDELMIDSSELNGIEFDLRMNRALSILLDERKLAVDAILVMYGKDSQNIMKELKERGIKIPGDIAVACLEDTEFANYSIAPLTTITYPWREVGYQGCEKMIKLINQEPIELSTPIYSKLIIRNSCGCSSNNIKLSKIEGRIKKPISKDKVDYQNIIDFTEELNEAYPYIQMNISKLLQSLVMDFKARSTTIFIAEFEHQLQEVISRYPYVDYIDEIEQLIYYVRSLIVSCIVNDSELLTLFEDIILKVQILLKDKTISVIGFGQIQLKQIDQELHQVSQYLINTFNTIDLLSVLEHSLPRLEIPSCYLYMFGSDSNDSCSMIFKYTGYHRIAVKEQCAKTSLIIADEIIEKHKRLLCQLLYVNEDYLGFIVFEPNLSDERIYHILSLHISSALKGAILLEDLKKEIALRKEKENQLIYIANYDSLTGLFNRRYFYQTIDSIIEKAVRQQNEIVSFYLLFIDFDGFKQVNDTYGHDIGDLLLIEISKRLTKAIKQSAYLLPEMVSNPVNADMKEAIYRLGGDEFTAIISQTRVEEVKVLAQHIIDTLREPFDIKNNTIFITCSVGISNYPEDADSTEMIIKYADRAMYRAKRQKDMYYFHEADN